MDLFDKFKDFTGPQLAKDLGIYPFFLPLENSEGNVAHFRGKEVIMIGSNNYLGLTKHPKVVQAAKDAVDNYGTSCTGSRLMNGTLELHLELEQRLAKLVGKEAALVFTTGYQTNLGAVTSIIGKNDFVILDKDAHASLVDASAMSLGTLKRFSHNDPDHLDKVLSNLPKDSGKLVAVDGVYSMGGDLANLPEIIPVCKKHGARLLVDDAHGVGLMAQGRGTSAHFGLTDEVDLIMGTFSKSFASIGGFIAGDEAAISYIKHTARPMLFSASISASNSATVLAALDILENEPDHVQRAWDNADFMRAGFKKLGYNIGQSVTPIVPVIIGEDARTVLAFWALIESGVFTNPVLPPGVPPTKSLLRTSYISTHTKEMLHRALKAFETVGHNLDLISPDATLD